MADSGLSQRLMQPPVHRVSTAIHSERQPRKASRGVKRSLRARVTARVAGTPARRDRFAAVTAAATVAALAHTAAAAGALSGVVASGAVAHVAAGLVSLLGAALAAAVYEWRRSRRTQSRLRAFMKEDEERRAIAAIGVGASWDLELHRIFARFAVDLRQLVPFDRFVITSARPDGEVEVAYVLGEAALPGAGSVVTFGSSEPDGLEAPERHGLMSKVTVPFLAVKGTVTLRSKRQKAYGTREFGLLRQVVAQVTPGVANALLFETSKRQLDERTGLAEIGRAATGAPALDGMMPAIGRSLAALLKFDQFCVVLFAGSDGTGRLAYWQGAPHMSVAPGAEVRLDGDATAFGGVKVADRLLLTAGDGGAISTSRATGHVWVHVPLRVQDQLLGLLALSGDRAAISGPAQLQLLEQVALQVAPAVRNAELLEAERGLKQVLDEQNHALQLAQQSKDRFLSTVSHELRTPLAVLSGFVDLMAGGALGEITSEQRHTLETMARNARRLGQLINDLLDISRLGAQSFKISPRPFNAAKSIREVARDIEQVLAEKNQRLEVDIPDGNVTVNADPDRFEQVLINLLTNASKYSERGSGVGLKAGWTERDLTVSVIDHGFGISREDQARLFEAFYRVDNQMTRAVPGTGLGLYITKSIIEMHGGAIQLESEPGRGTTVSFALPCVMHSAAMPANEAEPVLSRSRLYPEMDAEDIPLAA